MSAAEDVVDVVVVEGGRSVDFEGGRTGFEFGRKVVQVRKIVVVVGRFAVA